MLQIDQSAQKHQMKSWRRCGRGGIKRVCGGSLDALRRRGRGHRNTMPYILDAVRAYATLGEICGALREVFGTYQETSARSDTWRQPIRVLVAKPGLDGHDRGAKVIARALRDAGMEVIYTGLRQTPEMIVNAALQEDVQVIGLSILSGAHNAIVPRVMELLHEKEMDDVKVVIGGIIPDEDAAELKKQGVAAVFQPGASLDSIVDFVRSAAT